MRNWRVPLGFLIFLLLSSCASQQDLVNVERQLQTTRGEVAAMRKGMVDTRVAWEEQIRSSNQEQEESLSRVNGQLQAILSTIEAQQKAIASLSSSVQERLSAVNQKGEERLRRIEERIGEQEKGYLGSQGSLGTRFEELAAEMKIVQGRLEENNNLLAEHGARLDEIGQQASRSGARVETGEAEVKAIREAQSAKEERLKRIEEQVSGLMKSWEDWRRSANQSLSQVMDSQKRLREQLASLDKELGEMRKGYSQAAVMPAPSANREVKGAVSPESSPRAESKEVVTSKEPMASSSSPGGKEIYDRAKADYDQGDYDLAISGFRSYLSQYPRGSLAANSQYWLGECYYSQGKFKEAIREFEAVVKNYPTDSKASDALLKQGFAYLASDRVAEGKEILRRVLKEYPNTNAALLAKSRLERLK